jgi:hypothetical protein
MELRLEREQVDVLRRILQHYLGDLRFEISNTELYEFREGLKQDEAVIKDLIAQLEREDTQAA